MTTERYINLLRIAAIIVAVGMWNTSVNFSVDGFNFNIAEYGGVAWFLGIAITIIQLVWNRVGNANRTIMIVGIVAYAYGIYTNVIGIMAAQGTIVKLVVDGVETIKYNVTIFPIILGFFLEVTPEAILVWGLTGIADLGDFFGHVLGVEFPVLKKQQPKQQSNQKPQQQQPQQPKSNRNHGQSHRPNNRQRPTPPPIVHNMPNFDLENRQRK